MDHSDFHIGLEFWASGRRWRCTDVGKRTVVAIRIDEADARWYSGPPYAVEELVFDEDGLAACSLQRRGEEDERVTRAANSDLPEHAMPSSEPTRGNTKKKRKRRYPLCNAHPGALPVRHERHDAYFCIACDRWLEKGCSDPGCEFCKARPARPSLVMP